jgi:hypothetical protein
MTHVLHFGVQCPVQIVGKRQFLFSSIRREYHCRKTRGHVYSYFWGSIASGELRRVVINHAQVAF